MSESVRKDFPLLSQSDNPPIYLDSAATSLKPQTVIDAVTRFYTDYTANVHRSVHRLSETATVEYESAREQVASLINCDAREIAFTRNATEALNLVALSTPGGAEIALTLSEHHSNFLPWQGREHFFLPLRDDFSIDLDRAEALIKDRRPGLVTIATISNALGVRQPVMEIIEISKRNGALVMLDLSQSVGHEPVDLYQLDCDYACFSSHKMLGPSGVGVLYKREDSDAPLNLHYLGGEMVHEAHLDSFEARPFPWGMEAGTPNIEGVMGLGAAARYLQDVGIDAIHQHGLELARALRLRLAEHAWLTPVVENSSSSIVTFHMDRTTSHGLSRMLSNRFDIMIRSGFHCAQPLHEEKKISESNRASFHLYNTLAEVDELANALEVLHKSL